MQRSELAAYLERYLDAGRFKDYCPNGLQVEGRDEVTRIVSGVTASVQFLEAAIAAGADAVLVHHGYFWRGEDARVIGPRRRRLALLIENDVNLFAFHLPLDAHDEIGNNASLARELDLVVHGHFGEQDIGMHGECHETVTLDALAARIESRLHRKPLVIGEGSREVKRIAWCTGAAQGYLEDAVSLGVDVYLTGEASEQTVHLARESGVAFIAAGHHASERYGVQALGAHLAERFGIEHRFIDIANPV